MLTIGFAYNILTNSVRFLIYGTVLVLINLFPIQALANPINSEAIENLIKQKLPNTAVGIFIQDAKTGKVLYERRAEETFLPASTAKVISTASSLFILGPNFQYQTAFKTSPDVIASATSTGILKSDVFLEFSGDPSLKIEDLQKMVQELKSKGLTKIEGNIIIDNTLFKGKTRPYGWVADDLNWYFASPITTVILNENKVKLLVKSNKTLGDKATISLAPEETLPVNISQEVISVTEAEANESCELSLNMDQKNDMSLQGCWPASEKVAELYVAIQNPDLAAVEALKGILKAENISLNGKVIFAKAPKSLQTLVIHQSVSLETLIKFPLQDSNNLYSESLVKTMGVKQFQQGTFQAGLRAMRELLASKFGIDKASIRLQDGSGNSRYDAVSPAQLGRILYVMYHEPTIGKLFIDNLPNVSNTDYMKARMQSFDAIGIIRAKTGSMTGVTALAGYLKNKEKEDLIFVIMINGAMKGGKASKGLENEFCKLLIES